MKHRSFSRKLSLYRVAPIMTDALGDPYQTTHCFSVGATVELHPACDLWMRGARYATITGVSTDESGILRLRSTHPQVRRAIYVTMTDIRPVVD